MVERDGSAKGIVFSQFSSFLDLIHYALLKVLNMWKIWFLLSCLLRQEMNCKAFCNSVSLQSGVTCVKLDGSMSMGARDAAIKNFTEDPSCRIFLMSLKAGGVALNLTVASHVSFLFYLIQRRCICVHFFLVHPNSCIYWMTVISVVHFRESNCALSSPPGLFRVISCIKHKISTNTYTQEKSYTYIFFSIIRQKWSFSSLFNMSELIKCGWFYYCLMESVLDVYGVSFTVKLVKLINGCLNVYSMSLGFLDGSLVESCSGAAGSG